MIRVLTEDGLTDSCSSGYKPAAVLHAKLPSFKASAIIGNGCATFGLPGWRFPFWHSTMKSLL
jgi:hypothetical protein